ncbi:MAG: hypothetical protein IJC39_00340, partial [Firmicutes bacterium]|nr:hypothetical protein [Bacillota bacterium]
DTLSLLSKYNVAAYSTGGCIQEENRSVLIGHYAEQTIGNFHADIVFFSAQSVDENGEIMDGDKLMAVCGNYMKERGELCENMIVTTVMSNLGFDIFAAQHDIELEKTSVGDRYVLECMKEKGAALGGEQSGHIIFLSHNTTGDGTLTAIKTMGVLKRSGRRASELSGMMRILPQVLVNARVNNDKKDRYMEYPEIREAISALEERFKDNGRVLIRTSGTEPLIRVMIEGDDETVLLAEAENLAKLIEKVLKA